MTDVHITWTPFLSVSELPSKIDDLRNCGVYIWRVDLPKDPDKQYSYYVGSAAKRGIDVRFWEHLRDTLSFLYFIRDERGEWVPDKASIVIDQFWDRIRNIEENQKTVLNFIERSRMAWATTDANDAVEAEAAVYWKLREREVLLDNGRAPMAQHNIHNAFLNHGSTEIVSLLGKRLDFQDASM